MTYSIFLRVAFQHDAGCLSVSANSFSSLATNFVMYSSKTKISCVAFKKTFLPKCDQNFVIYYIINALPLSHLKIFQ